MADKVKKKRYRNPGGLKGTHFSLRERFDFVEGLYNVWLKREKLRLRFPTVEPLDGNIDVLGKLMYEEFSSTLDMKRKVRAWLQEVEGHLDKRVKGTRLR